MRYQKLIPIDQTAENFVQSIGQIRECETVLSGKVASVYRLMIGEESYCLKISANGEAAKEAMLYPLLKRTVAVPELVKAKGRMALSRWVDGMTMEEALKTADSDERRMMAFSAGETLATLHTIKSEAFGYIYDGEEGYPTAQAFLDAMLKRLFTSCLVREGLGLVFLDELRVYCQRNIRLFTGSPCLVHGDFKQNNIFTKDGVVNAVLDFGEAFGGSPYFDLAKAFRHLSDNYPDMKRPFISGYRRKGELDDDYEKKGRVFDVVMLLITINRLMQTSEPDVVKIKELRKYTEIIKENLYLIKP